ncbi:NAD(P)/FAD-dependent oxidoreductase [Photobacterium sp. 1_MG-2023]|uniref:phytoene desaturase family protein n=1 Tax=Photobacterium sp. 1_MG-2023 TaxID=3062646 RepID=UPI0026E23FF5|nr:NAD(P)/FAD-dependent oxidoreductase [Photobacterium sp. 1_MG-2023]MDO6708153.1 NAD(P)/FAD-dependent oxidoreductase [Photobacterium sp. 1_MG-2023]
MDKQILTVDEVVVGAGLTGLVYANVLAAGGKHVALIEKHTKPGGYATNFLRKRRYIFDCSLHKMTGFGESGNVENALKRAGLFDLIEFHPYHHLTTFRLDDLELTLPADGESMMACLRDSFPDEKAQLDAFCHDVKTHGYQNYMLARMALGEYEIDPELFLQSKQLSRISTYDYLKQRFDDPRLMTLFSSLAINLGVESVEADALYFLHFAYTFLYTEKRYVKGSSQALSDALAAAFVSKGGTLLVREEVNSIDVHHGRVTGVQSRRYDIRCDHLIFTGCPHQVLSLLPAENVPAAYRDKFDSLSFGLGAFIVYLGLDVPPSSIGFNEQDYLIASPDYAVQAKQACLGEERYDTWPLSISNYHALDENYGYVIQLEMLDQQDDWLTLPRREYKAKKAQITEKILQRALRYFPELKPHIAFIESSTPRTNQKFTNSGGGSSFGYKPLPGRNMRFLKKTPVEGLSFVGTWMNGAGYEPAICLGFTAATLKCRADAIRKSPATNSLETV